MLASLLHALEARRILPDLQLASERGGDIGKDEATAFERQVMAREQIQIVRRSMA